jgi:hypothetical protein
LHYVYIPHFVNLFICWYTPSCFYLWAIVNNATIICIHKDVYVSLLLIMSGIYGSYGHSTFWGTTKLFSKIHFYFFKFILKKIVVLGVHCGIYKSSYNVSNISYLNSPPPSFSFISPLPPSWNSFSRSHFSIYIYVYIVFSQYSPFPHILPSHWYQPSIQDLFSVQFCKRKRMTFCSFKIAIQEVSLEFPCIYVL